MSPHHSDPDRTLPANRPGPTAGRPGEESAAELTPLRRLAGTAALAAALALVAVLACLPLAHDDLFQHLATGERIAASGKVPTTDFLSHTRAGERWVSHEWGFALLVHGVHRLGGMPGLLAFKVALALALALAGLALGRRLGGGAAAAGWPLAGLLLVVAGWAVSRELILRAALAGVLMLVLTTLALLAFRRRPRTSRAAVVVGLLALWANLHSGVIFGLFLLGLFTLEALLAPLASGRREPPRPDRRRQGVWPWLVLAAAGTGATLVNPNGLDSLLYPFRLARLLSDPDSGFTRGHFAGGWPGPEKLLVALVVSLLVGTALVVLRRRSGDADGGGSPRLRDVPLPPPLWVAVTVFALLSWRSSRLAVELAVLATPAAYAVWSRWLALRLRHSPAPALRATLTAVAGAAAAGALALSLGVLAVRPPGVVAPHFPSGLVAHLRAHPPQGRLFNHQNWGGYLYWHLREPIYWDGRNLLFAPLVREWVTSPRGRVLERHDVEVLVLSPREIRALRDELASGRWRLTHADESGAVFRRRGGDAPPPAASPEPAPGGRGPRNL